MTQPTTNPELTPWPVRVARPLIDSFMRSGQCPAEDAVHARSTLPVLALFVSMIDEHDSRGLPWHRLDPRELMAAAVDSAGESDPAFSRDLLAVSSAFYGFLAHVGVLRRDEAYPIRARLASLLLGLTRDGRRRLEATEPPTSSG